MTMKMKKLDDRVLVNGSRGRAVMMMMIITAFGATNVPAANNKWN